MFSSTGWYFPSLLLIVILSHSLSPSLFRPPPLPHPLFLSLPLVPPGPGVFLEVNEKRNPNRLPLKGMSGSAGWKLVLLMSLTFFLCEWVICDCKYACVRGCVQRWNAVGWGTRREGGWASSEQTYVFRKGGGFRGIFDIFQEPFQSGSRCILLPGDLAERPDGQRSREEKKGEHHALLPISLVMPVVEDGTDYTYRAKAKKKIKKIPPQ